MTTVQELFECLSNFSEEERKKSKIKITGDVSYKDSESLSFGEVSIDLTFDAEFDSIEITKNRLGLIEFTIS